MGTPSMSVGSVGKSSLIYATPRALQFSADPAKAAVFTATVRGVTTSFQASKGTALALQVTQSPTVVFETQKASQIVFSVGGPGGGGGGGTGTVTSVSVVAANGVSGIVANPTTTPAITLTLGNITPTSVAATGNVTGANLSGTNTGNVTIGTANGLSIVGQALSLGLASTNTIGALSDTDWNTFNNKAAAGSYITALTGDGIASGPGSAVFTLATVNGNVGTFGSATQAVVLTINGKGLITAASETTITPAIGNITGLGTGIAAALAINVGSVGAPVILNGALGTPSSGTASNLTGTATGLTSGITLALKSATTTVDVSAATAPTSGQVLTATSATTATWQSVAGTGDMTKAVYDPQNVGLISGDDSGSKIGGRLQMDAFLGNGGNITTIGSSAGGTGNGGEIDTRGNGSGNGGKIITAGHSGGAMGGAIETYGATGGIGGQILTHGGSVATSNGGEIHTHGGTASGASGGAIHTEGGTVAGGAITTSNGGGAINTTGTGSIGLGVIATRTTLVGTATTARSISLPDADGTIALESTLATEQATTSGTSKDFTGIPAGTKRITIMLVGVSTNGTSNLLIQIGDSGGVENTGYTSDASIVAATVGTTASTTGFVVAFTGATSIMHGSVTLNLENSSDNKWVSSGIITRSVATGLTFSAGSKALSAVLDRVRITTVNGTDAFDAGVVNIAYSK